MFYNFSASDVGHVNLGTEHELQQRRGNNNRYEAGLGNDADDATTGYENLGGPRRPASMFPDVYEELDNRK